MIGNNERHVERKIISILKILSEAREPVGARIISRQLKSYGIELTERAVRYHLKLMDERGLTALSGRSGRVITPSGREELKNALVGDKVGFVISRIELLAFRTTFDWKRRVGGVPVNFSFFSKDEFPAALKAMKGAFESGLCVSDLVAVAEGGETLGEITVPAGKVGFATVCSIIVNGALLKAGIPMDSRFGGILQIRNNKPLRFVELIHYAGSSLDPSEIFIRGGMTDVMGIVKEGNGKILANFREVPAQSRQLAETVIAQLEEADLRGVVVIGDTSELVCEVPVDFNKVGMILRGGLNPVAAALEAGVQVDNIAMGGIIDYQDLVHFRDL